MKDLKSINKKINSLTLILEKLKEQKIKLEVLTLLEVQLAKNIQALIKENKLNDDLYFTTNQVLLKYNISRSTLERAIRDGLQFTSKKEGAKRTFKKLDLDTYFFNTNN